MHNILSYFFIIRYFDEKSIRKTKLMPPKQNNCSIINILKYKLKNTSITILILNSIIYFILFENNRMLCKFTLTFFLFFKKFAYSAARKSSPENGPTMAEIKTFYSVQHNELFVPHVFQYNYITSGQITFWHTFKWIG